MEKKINKASLFLLFNLKLPELCIVIRYIFTNNKTT